jgi:hypothetical protein
MIPVYLYLVGSGLVGFGFWIGRVSGRSAERHDRESILGDVERIRAAYAIAALPAQQGTLAENRLELTATPHVPQVEESWPLLWRVLWPVLLFAAHFWWTPVGVGLDRAAVWLWGFLGRRERHWWNDYNTGAHRLVTPEQQRREWVGELVGTT